jgi:gliding motility-associated-like protein
VLHPKRCIYPMEKRVFKIIKTEFLKGCIAKKGLRILLSFLLISGFVVTYGQVWIPSDPSWIDTDSATTIINAGNLIDNNNSTYGYLTMSVWNVTYTKTLYLDLGSPRTFNGFTFKYSTPNPLIISCNGNYPGPIAHNHRGKLYYKNSSDQWVEAYNAPELDHVGPGCEITDTALYNFNCITSRYWRFMMIGNYWLGGSYQTTTYYKVWEINFREFNNVSVTLAPFPDICENASPILLSGGLPTGGTYSGAGVTNGYFDPGIGPGTYNITYSYGGSAGCGGTASQFITVLPGPTATFNNALAPQSVYSTSFSLSGGSPAGGTYSGPGVSGNNFNASIAGIGIHTITYTYTQPGTNCSSTATNTIQVANCQEFENGGFEIPNQSAGTMSMYHENQVPGWETTASDHLLEFWGSGFLGVPAYEGNQFVEINATQFAALFQDIPTTPGDTMVWSFAHRARAGIDVIRVKIGSPGNTTDHGTFSSPTTEWQIKSGIYVVPPGITISRFEFEAISTGSGSISVGNFIDAVKFSTANAANNSPICSGSTLNLSCTPFGAASYQWSGPNGFSSTLQSPAILNATPSASGVYAVTITLNNGCQSIAYTNVTINPGGSATAISNGPLCQGQTLQLTATPAGVSSYSWTGPNAWSSNIQNPTIPDITTAQSGIYTVTVTGSGGCMGIASTNLSVLSTPSLSVTNNGPLCAGETALLQCSTSDGNTYNWSGPGTYNANTQNTSISNTSTSQSGTYTVTVTYNNGCTAQSSTNLTVHETPGGSAGSNSPLCSGETLLLNCTGSIAYSYNWSGPGGFSSTQQNPAITGVLISNGGNYIVTITHNNGCKKIINANVVVNPVPAPFASSNSPICDGETLILTLSVTGNNSFQWTGPQGFTSDQENPQINVANPAQSGTYYVTVTNNLGCNSTTSVFATINPKPSALATSNSPVCENDDLLLSGGPIDQLFYHWSGPQNYTSTLASPVISAVNINNAGTYSLIVTNAFNCSDTVQTVVTVTPLPQADAGNNQEICPGEQAQLSASGGTTYSWSPSVGLSDPGIANPLASPGITTQYYVTVSQDNCSNTDFVTVTVLPLPLAEAGQNQEICQGESVDLLASGGDTYQWSNGPISAANPVNPPQTTTYFLTVTNNFGCENYDSVIVVVHLNPILTPSADEATICRDSVMALNVTGASSYTWSPGIGLSQTFGSQVYASPKSSTQYLINGQNQYGCQGQTQVMIWVVQTPVSNLADSMYLCLGEPFFLDAGNNAGANFEWQDGTTDQHYFVTKPGYYSVTVSNEGCSIQKGIDIKECTRIWVPNAFNPGEEGVNKVFYAKASTELRSFQLVIFNRWGEQIYESHDIYEGWDGTYEGANCPVGIYTYRLIWEGYGNNASEMEGMMHGSIFLLR